MNTQDWTHRTLIVTADLAPLARELASLLSPAGTGMFETALSPNGEEPATHFISAGFLEPAFGELLRDPIAFHAACAAAGSSVGVAQCENLIAASDVSDGAPSAAMTRLRLQLVVEHADTSPYVA
ncbi:hypothetical protein [Lysobacter arvi]|uniref:Uncharacterized protein n=1 Tax=Lysobacter arvi TaxID=3038776 RepID=A0ABU1CBC0_9GAMM|nr:hypothetical protein [Lysobacter arvi]MDR0182410.1 hypothetical protein [Lysobacter arvi]